MAPTQAPIWLPPLSGRDRAVIAGFLLHYREGILDALDNVTNQAWDHIPDWAVGMRRFYQDGEAWSRFLLHWVGYDVKRNQMYVPP